MVIPNKLDLLGFIFGQIDAADNQHALQIDTPHLGHAPP